MSKRRKRAVFPCALVAVACMACSSLMAHGVSKTDADANMLQEDLVENFGITLESVELSARVPARNENGATEYGLPECRITIALRYEMSDGNEPVAIDANPARILGVFDDLGRAVNVKAADYSAVRRYEEVRWTPVQGGMGYVRTLQPSGQTIDLILDHNEPIPSSLSRVEGYIWALCSEEIIEADVAYEVDAVWNDPERDLQVSVLPQTPPTPGPIEFEAIPGVPRGAGALRPTAPVALWQYETRVYSTSNDVLPLDGEWVCGPLVDDYVLIKTQLVEANWVVAHVSNQRSRWGYEDDCICWGQAEQSHRDYGSIRHVIAVHPVEVKVPFVLTDIPIPTFSISIQMSCDRMAAPY